MRSRPNKPQPMRILRIIALAGAVAAYVPPPPQRETKRNVVVAAQSTLERPVLQATVEDQTERNNVLNLPESEKITLETPLEAGRRGPSEFELNLGRAIDALRSDVPAFADRELSWDIYADNVQLADPSGVQTRGLQNYKQFFGVIRMFRRVMIDKVDITFKLRYDWSSKIIKVTWYSKMVRARLSKPLTWTRRLRSILDDQREGLQARRGSGPGRRAAFSPPYSVGWLAFREYVLAGLDVPATRSELRLRVVGRRRTRRTLLSDVGVRRRVFRGAAEEEEGAPAKEKKQKRKLLPGTMRGMWDCDSPMECCDFVMFKMLLPRRVGIPAFPRAGAVARPPFPSRSAGPPGMPGGAAAACLPAAWPACCISFRAR